MVTEEMVSDKILRRAVEKCVEAIIANLLPPEECNLKFFRVV